MSNEVKKQDYAETYLGTFGGFLPLLSMIALIVVMSILGMRSAQNYICAGFAAVIVGFLVFKDKGRFQNALLNGMRNPTFGVLVLIFIIAAVFAQILQVGQLTSALVIVLEALHVPVSVLPMVAFLIGCVMSTASGSSSAAILSLLPILLPLTVQLGANPALMVAAVCSGGIFGDNISPISDTTIASTQSVGADIPTAVRERVKYSAAAAIPCLILFLVFGITTSAQSVPVSGDAEGSIISLMFLLLPVLLVIMILKGVNFIAALLTNTLVGAVMLVVLGFANFETFFGKTGIVISGISGMTNNIFFMMFIFLVLAITEESGALNTLSGFMGKFAKSTTSAEAVCGLFMCLTTAVTTSGVSSMGFCGPIINKVLTPFKVSPERMSNFMDGFGCAVVNLVPYSAAVVGTVAFSIATGAVDSSFTAFTYLKYNFYPIALLIVYAPSKTFNLAGLVGSYDVIYNKWLRDRTEKEANLFHHNKMNMLSMYALIGAYKPEGYEWTDELCQVIAGNMDYACDYIEKHFDGVKVSKPQGTYMLFVDCTEWCEKHDKTILDVEKAAWDVGVACQDGRMFHGPCHLRMNLALPLTRVQEAFTRLDKYVFNA